MIRTVITSYGNSLILPLPQNYIGKPLEVIAFAIDEPDTQQKTLAAKNAFTAISIDTRGFTFNRDEANER